MPGGGMGTAGIDWCTKRFEPCGLIILRVITRAWVSLRRSVVTDVDWRFDNLIGSHLNKVYDDDGDDDDDDDDGGGNDGDDDDDDDDDDDESQVGGVSSVVDLSNYFNMLLLLLGPCHSIGH